MIYCCIQNIIIDDIVHFNPRLIVGRKSLLQQYIIFYYTKIDMQYYIKYLYLQLFKSTNRSQIMGGGGGGGGGGGTYFNHTQVTHADSGGLARSQKGMSTKQRGVGTLITAS